MMLKYLSLLLIITVFSIHGYTQNETVSLRYFELSPDQALSSLNDIPDYMGQKHVFMQFDKIPDYQQQANLKQNGFHLLTYLSNRVYIASVSSAANYEFLQAAGFIHFYEIKPAYTTDPTIQEYFRTHSISGEKTEVIISVFNDVKIHDLFEKEKLTVGVVHVSDALKSMVVLAGYEQLQELATKPWVKWMGINHIPMAAVNQPSKNHIRSNILQAGVPNGIPLTGKQVKVGEWDAGMVGSHIDYNNRLVIRNGNSVHNHSTHVAGTVGGAGIIDGYYEGMAPEALLYSWDFYDYIPFEMDSAIGLDSIVITQNSYAYDPNYDTCSFRGRYDWSSSMMDQLVNTYPYYMHVFAAGNYRSQCGQGGYRTVSSGFQAGKNSLSVAAVYESDAISWFSSWGPVRDGRLKPEISAVGINVQSTLPNNLYSGNWNGTSMACPAVSGTVAQLFEGYKYAYGVYPEASVTKAILCNTAIDKGNPGPDFRFGFGVMNAINAYKAILNHHFIYDSLAQGNVFVDTLTVDSATSKLKVLLCWSDLPADAYVKSDSSALINLLNLAVYDTAGNPSYPLILDPFNPNATAIQGIDTLNNSQQVVIKNIQPGKYIIKVAGTHIPLGRQTFAVSYEQIKPGLSITFPAGNEQLLPATSYTIRWDPSSLSGYYQLGYSIDSGNNWTTIHNTVNILNRYYHWQTPDTFSSSCLVRLVYQGDTTTSDTFFSILARPSGLTTVSCNNQITLKWNPVASVDSYRVYLLDTNAQWQLAGTSQDTLFPVLNLNNTQNYWLTVAAVYPSNSESKKAFAIQATPDSSLFPPLVVLDISTDTVCSGSNKLFTTKTNGTMPLQYLWFEKQKASTSWDSLNSATDTFLSLTSFVATDDKTQFRMQVINSCQSPVYTSTATIRVDTGIHFLLPSDTIISCEQDTVTYFQSYHSIMPVSRIWQQSLNQGNSWTGMSNETDTFLVLNNLAYTLDQNLYRLSASSSCTTQSVSPADLLRVHPPLTVKIINNPDTVCYGNIFTLGVQKSGGDSFSYSVSWPGRVVQGDYLTDTLFADKTFIVKLTDSCSFYEAFDTVTVHVLPKLDLYLTSSADSLCAGQSVTIEATANGGDTNNYSILWNDALLNGFSNTFVPQHTGIWKANLTDGCSATSSSDSVFIFVRPGLELQLFSQQDTFCFGSILDLSATTSGGDSSQYSILWNDSFSTGKQYSTTADSSAWFSAALSDQCTTQNATDSIFINVLEALQVKLNPDSITKICNGNTVLFHAIPTGGNGDYTFMWNDSLVSPDSLSRQMFSSQWTKVNLSDNCSHPDAMDSVFITVLPPLHVEIIYPDDTVCAGSLINLTTNSSGGLDSSYSYSWQPPRSTSGQFSDTVLQDNRYKVTLYDNCSLNPSSDSIRIFVEKIDAHWQYNADYLQVNFHADDSIQKSYLWVIDEQDSLPGFKSSFNFDTTSKHHICLQVTTFKNCVDHFCDSIQVYFNGIKEQENAGNIILYPNPTSGYLVIKNNSGVEIKQLVVSDISGKVVVSRELSLPGKGEFSTNFSHLPKGAYILKLRDAYGMTSLIKLLKL